MPDFIQVRTDIWSDPGFLALAHGPQWMYLALTTQPAISMCGVLIMRERYWATLAADLGAGEQREWLGALAAARLIVLDESTDELLVRTKIRREPVPAVSSPKLVKPLTRACQAVTSGPLRGALAEELRLCQQEGLVHASIAAQIDRLAAWLEHASRFVSEPLFSQVDRVSDAVPDTAPDRSHMKLTYEVDVEGGSGGELVSVNGSGRGPATRGKSAGQAEGFDEFWLVYPRRVGKGAARNAWAKAVRKADPADIIKAAAAYRDWPGRKPDYTAHPTTWLNQERWTDELPADARSGPFTAADALRSALTPDGPRPSIQLRPEPD
jgi:hypothetical protein